MKWLAAFALAAGIVMLIRLFCIESYRISTDSMEEALHKGDYILVNKIPGKNKPVRGKVVLFTSPLSRDSADAPLFISRCIGMPGDTIRVMGPLGNGFTVEPGKKAFLIGGGIGIPPMLELAKSIKAAGTCEFVSVMGYRDAQTFLLDEFKEQGDCYVATEDGSVGAKGNVLDAMKEYKLNADVIYACGPTPMLRALKAYAAEQGMTCYISMEERMACGIGACLACVCNSKEKDAHSNVKNKRICKEGPVFLAEEVDL